MVRFKRLLLLLILPLLVMGCTAPVEPAPLSPGHPASPQALEAEAPARSQTLSFQAVPPSPAEARAEHIGHAGHGMAARNGSAPAATRPATTQAAYVCPMHPEVTSAQPGKCPQCGMNLVPSGEKR